jgi:hypothetical protein
LVIGELVVVYYLVIEIWLLGISFMSVRWLP